VLLRYLAQGATGVIPALANTLSSVPFSRWMCAKRRSRSPRFDTSPWTPATLLPISLIAAANSRSRRPVMKTYAPSLTNCFAVARPMPLWRLMPYRVLCKRFLEPPCGRLQKSFTQNSVWHQSPSSPSVGRTTFHPRYQRRKKKLLAISTLESLPSWLFHLIFEPASLWIKPPRRSS